MSTSKRFEEIIIHIGTERTSSKSIQTVLARNRACLLHAGVLVPRSLAFSEDLANHTKLMMMCVPLTHFEDLCPPGIIGPDFDINAFQGKLLEDFDSEVNRTAAEVTRVLISSEYFHSRLGALVGVQNMFTVLSRYTKSFKIIAFIRPQIECAVSLFNLALRRGATEIRLIPHFDGPRGFDRILGVGRSYFNYEALLSRYETIFGRESMRLFLYASRSGQDPLTNLARETRLLDMLPSIPFKNSSLNSEAQQFQLLLNKCVKEAPETYEKSLLLFIDDFLISNYKGRGLLPKRSEAVEFMDMFAAGNEQVRAKYFPDAKFLFEPSWEQFPEESQVLETHLQSNSICMEVVKYIWSQRERPAMP